MSSSPLARSTISVKDVLVSVNGRDVINEEFEDVIDFIDMIRCVYTSSWE